MFCTQKSFSPLIKHTTFCFKLHCLVRIGIIENLTAQRPDALIQHFQPQKDPESFKRHWSREEKLLGFPAATPLKSWHVSSSRESTEIKENETHEEINTSSSMIDVKLAVDLFQLLCGKKTHIIDTHWIPDDLWLEKIWLKKQAWWEWISDTGTIYFSVCHLLSLLNALNVSIASALKALRGCRHGCILREN